MASHPDNVSGKRARDPDADQPLAKKPKIGAQESSGNYFKPFPTYQGDANWDEAILRIQRELPNGHVAACSVLAGRLADDATSMYKAAHINYARFKSYIRTRLRVDQASDELTYLDNEGNVIEIDWDDEDDFAVALAEMFKTWKRFKLEFCVRLRDSS